MSTSPSDSLKRACGIFLQDLQALPEEAFDKSFGRKTRTVADIVYEVNLVNDHIAMNIRGEEALPFPDEGWIKAPEDFRTKEAVIAGFQKSSQTIIATAEGFSEVQLEETVKTERGESTRTDRIRFMALHLWYHSGQLNFIQTLMGDDGWHWE
ncbi:MAG: DinB family protein [Fimbriimonadaceae bacterium]